MLFSPLPLLALVDTTAHCTHFLFLLRHHVTWNHDPTPAEIKITNALILSLNADPLNVDPLSAYLSLTINIYRELKLLLQELPWYLCDLFPQIGDRAVTL